MANLSARLAAIVEALPLHAGMRVIEIGCGPGAAARAVAGRVGPAGHVQAIDRLTRVLVPDGRLFIDGAEVRAWRPCSTS